MTWENTSGTMETSWGIGGAIGAGVQWKDNAGVVQLRNGPDTAYADLWTGNLRVQDPVIGANDNGAAVINGVVRFGTGLQSYGIGVGGIVGNARGLGAVDLQSERSLGTQVASGAYSVLLGGRNNTASGDLSIAWGDGSRATGPNSIAGGEGAQATGTGSIAIGRLVVSSGLSAAAFGYRGQATADYATALCAEALADQRGMVAYSGGQVTTLGDSQSCLLTWGRQTTNAAATTLGLDGAGAVELVVGNDTTYGFALLVVATVAGGTAAKQWSITFGVRRPGAGAAVFIGGAAPVPTVLFADAALAAATIAVSLPGGGTVRLTATGLAGTTIRWTVANIGPRAVG